MEWIILAIIILAAVYFLSRKDRSAAAASTRSRSQSPSQTHTTSSHSVNSRSEVGPMIYYANDPHHLGDREYRFRYKWVYDTSFGANTWRAYIVRMPSLRGRPNDGHSTHHWSDADGNWWICWDRALTDLSEIQSVSRIWADSIQEYIATGKRFG